MNIGQLTRKITIERPELIQDASGQEIENWQPFAVLAARKIRRSAQETLTGENLGALQVEVYHTRYKAGINERMRLTDEAKVYNIRAVEEIGRNHGLQITAEHRG